MGRSELTKGNVMEKVFDSLVVIGVIGLFFGVFLLIGRNVPILMEYAGAIATGSFAAIVCACLLDSIFLSNGRNSNKNVTPNKESGGAAGP